MSRYNTQEGQLKQPEVTQYSKNGILTYFEKTTKKVEKFDVPVPSVTIGQRGGIWLQLGLNLFNLTQRQ